MMQEIAETEEREAQEASKPKKRSSSLEKSHSGVSDVTMEDLTVYEDDFHKYEELVSRKVDNCHRLNFYY
jgi:gamma-glutamylcysteine synthetase